MATTVAQKLKIKEGDSLLTLNAPAGFMTDLNPLPNNVTISPSAKIFRQIHWFVKAKTEMEKEMDRVIARLKDDIVCWIYYPKGTSKIQTDLTRDKGWENLLKHDELYWISLISFNNTWSAFGMRLKTAADKKREEKPKEREIFNYIDPVAKTVNLPDDLRLALAKAAAEEAFFNSLSFTNKKEYMEWIVTAKRDETRRERVRQTVERLGKRWKNPSNR